MSFSKILLKFEIFSKFFQYCPFLSLTTTTGQRNFQVSEMGYLTEISSQKIVLIFFIAQVQNFFFNFAFSFFYDLFINKVRKLEVAVSNPIIEDIPASFSLSRLGLLSFSFSFTFYLSLSLFLLNPHFSCCYVA